MSMSKFIPTPMAAMMPMDDGSQPAAYGLDYGNNDVPSGFADSLAHGIDFDTPGVSLFAVALGYAHEQLAAQAQAEFATGKHTLH